MAERWAVATGNWSATGTWNGGTLPTTGDTVHANNFTVTIDQNITVGSLRTTAGTTPVAGGAFTTSGNRTLTCDVVAGTTAALTVNAGSSLVGNTTGGSSSNAIGATVINGATQTGNSTGGSAAGAYGTKIRLGATQAGNATGGSNASAYGTYAEYQARLIGNSTGSATTPGSYIQYGAVLYGNTVGGSAAAGTGSQIQQGGYHVGIATGGSSAFTYGTYALNGGIFYGHAVGGSVANAFGAFAFQGGIVALTAVTQGTGGAMRLHDDGAVVLYNGLTTSDITIAGTRYQVGNQYLDFLQPPVRFAFAG